GGIVAAGQAPAGRSLHLPSDGLHRLEVAGRSDREAGLDHVDAEIRQCPRHLKLLRQVHAGARALLAVAQRRVENNQVFMVAGVLVHGGSSEEGQSLRGVARASTKKALESTDSRASDSQLLPALRLPRTLESVPLKGDEKVQ